MSLLLKIIQHNSDICKILQSTILNQNIWEYYIIYFQENVKQQLEYKILARHLLENPEEIIPLFKVNGPLANKFLEDNHRVIDCVECCYDLDCYYEDDIDMMALLFRNKRGECSSSPLTIEEIREIGHIPLLRFRENLNTTYFDDFVNLSKLVTEIYFWVNGRDVKVEDEYLIQMHRLFIGCSVIGYINTYD